MTQPSTSTGGDLGPVALVLDITGPFAHSGSLGPVLEYSCVPGCQSAGAKLSFGDMAGYLVGEDPATIGDLYFRAHRFLRVQPPQDRAEGGVVLVELRGGEGSPGF